MIPHERSLIEQLQDQPFAIVGVSSDTDEEIIKNYEETLPWRNIHDPPQGNFGPIAKAWNVRSWPTVYLLDAKGKIRHKYLRGSKMDQAIESLLDEMGVQVELSRHK